MFAVTLWLIAGAFIVGCGCGWTAGAWWYGRPRGGHPVSALNVLVTVLVVVILVLLVMRLL
jgi:hypothetical protein